ncbi:hypothetical protein VNO77_22491 [Canavalia gladiata]|uniref:Uncharacterized protein n=1 Tax=Canavalia gladiata TaxID=3824 RepID=A0AAN9QAL8_CANGL
MQLGGVLLDPNGAKAFLRFLAELLNPSGARRRTELIPSSAKDGPESTPLLKKRPLSLVPSLIYRGRRASRLLDSGSAPARILSTRATVSSGAKFRPIRAGLGGSSTSRIALYSSVSHPCSEGPFHSCSTTSILGEEKNPIVNVPLATWLPVCYIGRDRVHRRERDDTNQNPGSRVGKSLKLLASTSKATRRSDELAEASQLSSTYSIKDQRNANVPNTEPHASNPRLKPRSQTAPKTRSRQKEHSLIMVNVRTLVKGTSSE